YREILYSHKHKDSLLTIAKNIKCNKTIVYDTLKQYTETGSTVPKKCLDSKPIFNEAALEELKQIFSQNYNTQIWHTLTEEFDKSYLVSILELIIPICGRMNSEAYVKLLRRHAILVVCQLVPNRQGIFQQDNASAHTCFKVKNVFKNANISVLL
ncbi:1463_t:CDS:2, partial [Scutellospora calospora]